MIPELRLIHLQLTKTCNLRCSFCGQWGEHGYMKASGPADLSTKEWLSVIAQAAAYRRQTGVAPQFILWGGEPLASPSFATVSTALRDAGFTTALITNGVLIEKHIQSILRNIDTLYVSLDGPAEVHEQIRGSHGIFSHITNGLSLLRNSGITRVCLFTLCSENCHCAVDFPYQLKTMGFEHVIYQNLIYCNTAQAQSYRHWLRKSFGQEAPRLTSWISDRTEPWMGQLPGIVRQLKENIAARAYPLDVQLYPAELNVENIAQWYDATVHIKETHASCKMPFRHLQINHDGNVNFCVDFNDFTLGNIRDHSLMELFHSELAAKFRAESPFRNSLCARCPWYYNESLCIDSQTPFAQTHFA